MSETRFTISEAARQVKLNKSIISRAVKTGAIEAEREGNRVYIRASVLFQKYPPKAEEQQLETQIKVLEECVNGLRQTLRAKEETIQFLQHFQELCDRQQTTINNQTLLLTHQKQQNETKRNGLWSRIFGKNRESDSGGGEGG